MTRSAHAAIAPPAPPRLWIAWLAALLILVLGGTATWYGWHWFARQARADVDAALDARLTAAQSRASAYLALSSENLVAMAELLRAGQPADTGVFRQMVRNLMRQHPEIAAVGWVPRPGAEPAVPDPACVAVAAASSVTDADAAVAPADPAATAAAAPDCTAEAVETRHSPVAVLIANPDGPGNALGDGSDWIGRDLGDSAVLRTVVDQSSDATGISYLGLDPDQWALFYPVAGDQGLRGHMLAVIAAPLLLDNVVRGEAAEGLARRLRDPIGAAGKPQLLHEEGQGTVLRTVQAPVAAFGRNWELELGALDGFVAANQSPLPLYVLVGGAALTLLLTIFAFTMLSRTARVRQLVNRRTAELSDAYQRVRDSEMMAMQSEKMSSLGQMVAGVAHEINTPLGFISSNVQLLRELLGRVRPLLENQGKLMGAVPHWTRLSAEQKQMWFKAALQQSQSLAQVRQEGISEDLDSLTSESLAGLERLTDLVLTLKNFSRLDRSLVDDVDLNQCIEDTLKIAHNVIKQKAEVETQLQPLPKIRCNPSQFNQVLLNLITNSAHAIPKFGRIQIESRVDGQQIVISVRDNGAGIPPDVLPRIFEPFFTTKGHGEGTGLGLPISRRIIEEHGGSLDVESHSGVGTVFVIRLPTG